MKIHVVVVSVVVALCSVMQNCAVSSHAGRGGASSAAAIQQVLSQSDKALASKNYAGALKYALQARRMPQDLDDVELGQQIDTRVMRASDGAESQVREWMAAGRYTQAVELSQQIVMASPSDGGRAAWAREISAQALTQYQKAIAEAQAAGAYGSAAVQMALSKQVGANVSPDAVHTAWQKFVQQSCFASPDVEIHLDAKASKSAKAKQWSDAAASAIRQKLGDLAAQCSGGTRKLHVTLDFSELKVVDKSEVTKAAKALPGYEIATEEVYYEEEPYTEVVNITDYVTRVEQQEKRDCAPRPGKPRGCQVWTENVEVKVPVTRTEEVQKIRRIEKRRPIAVLPSDKALVYEVNTVTRQIVARAKLSIAGTKLKAVPISVDMAATDTTHGAVKNAKMSIAADPLEIASLEDMLSSAAAQAADNVQAAFVQNLRDAGAHNGGEELYLTLYALHSDAFKDGSVAEEYFVQRYGKSLDDVMTLVIAAMQKTAAVEPVASTPAVAEESAASQETSEAAPTENKAQEAVAEEAPAATPAAPAPSDDFKDLEDASMSVDDNTTSDAAPVIPGAMKTPEASTVQ